ncbi:MAG TPA: choice-of-anchor R domain-containing protein, partial [Solirubrobacteraceae bacterium]|nr:choice-of-anchor R domain-containing protein [Solirubrobacteraceae bacterium]
MLKSLSRATLTAVVLLLALATTSALAARSLHGEKKRAERARTAHRHSHRHPRRHTARRSNAGAAAAVRTANTATAVLLGDETVEWGRGRLYAGQAEAFPFQARPGGTAGAVHVYVAPGNAATTLVAGLYSDNGGQPGVLLTAGSLVAPAAGAWDTVTVPPTQLSSGTTYWLAVLGTGGTLHFRDRIFGFCRAFTSAQTGLATPPATWSTGYPRWACPISAYATAAIAFPVEPPTPVEIGSPNPPTESESTNPTPPTETTPPR